MLSGKSNACLPEEIYFKNILLSSYSRRPRVCFSSSAIVRSGSTTPASREFLSREGGVWNDSLKVIFAFCSFSFDDIPDRKSRQLAVLLLEVRTTMGGSLLVAKVLVSKSFKDFIKIAADINLRIFYVLVWWEGSTSNAAILMSTVRRPNELKMAFSEQPLSFFQFWGLVLTLFTLADHVLALFSTKGHNARSLAPSPHFETLTPQPSLLCPFHCFLLFWWQLLEISKLGVF
ncbi:hypothetical protein M5K25_024052 [Dendrobium thyrsiflorum]|uniref:Uncharacterized protein n=1 Tax=Dendrobium thyrsiflorum TaxID=117978 RepID=A0ABD0U1B0_DENTH